MCLVFPVINEEEGTRGVTLARAKNGWEKVNGVALE
jgi:hypothetical protein